MSNAAYSTSTPGTTGGDLADRLGLQTPPEPAVEPETPPAAPVPAVEPETPLAPADPEPDDDADHDDDDPEPDTDADHDDDADDQDGRTKAAREAKRYRLRLAESKAENLRLVEHVQELQTWVARSLVAGKLARADDFDVFIGLDKVLDKDGRIDRAKVSAEVDALLADRPHLGSKAKAPSRHPRLPEGNVATGGQTPAANGRRTLSEQMGPASVSMSDLLHPQGERRGAVSAKKAESRLRLGSSD